jgi:hypothetical protein
VGHRFESCRDHNKNEDFTTGAVFFFAQKPPNAIVLRSYVKNDIESFIVENTIAFEWLLWAKKRWLCFAKASFFLVDAHLQDQRS